MSSGRILTALRWLPLLVLLAPSVSIGQPNFVVLLVDDAALMDFGSFGGEARTPHIDRLAEEGVRFGNFHTSPLCATSRAMLLTGLDSHRTGVGTLPETVTRGQRGAPGYAMRLKPEVKTIAERLRAAGYETFMTGKWHLGRGEGELPDAHGFDRSFALGASGADNWEQKSFIPFYEDAPWFEDGEPATLPDDFYSSRFLVDKMIEYLDERDRARPFFAYVAFQAVHIPVQAPREFTERYAGVYENGWEATRLRRFERARSLGLAPADAVLPALHPSLRSWESLTAEERARYERAMMVNAGMLEAMDLHIGRLVSSLESHGELDDTVFIVTSDNGPEFSDPTTEPVFRVWMAFNGYDTDLDRMGEPGSMVAIGPEWARAAAVPGSLFKMYASEGGTRVPLIIRGPGIARHPGFHGASSFVTDLAPTVAGLAGLAPDPAVDGRSLVPVLRGERGQVHADDEPIAFEVAGNSAVFQGRYKLTRNTLPHGDGEWRLHDLQRDPAEARDLSQERPRLRAALLDAYERYADAVGVVALPRDFDVQAQVGANVRRRLVRRYVPALIGGGIIVPIVSAWAIVAARRRRSDPPYGAEKKT